jgi:universal stress protein A
MTAAARRRIDPGSLVPMKVKPTPKRGRVVVEVDRKDERLLDAAEHSAQPSPSPFNLRQILVPIDFSACSRKALEYAVPLARQFGARLVLLHVMPVNYFVGSEFGPVDLPIPEAEWRAASEKELQSFADRTIGSQALYETQIRQGQPMVEITACADEINADLILVSTHGRTGLRHVLVGSVTENVVRYAPCPVLVVREHEHEFVAVTDPESRPTRAGK